MAGAATASVPARAGTILGVTRSDANPTYRRLEQYEPLLRLAVPALLALFLLTLAASAWIQVREGRESTLSDAVADIDIIASLSAAKLGIHPAPADRNAAAAQLDALVRGMPPSAFDAEPHARARQRGRQGAGCPSARRDRSRNADRPSRRSAAALHLRRPRRRHDHQARERRRWHRDRALASRIVRADRLVAAPARACCPAGGRAPSAMCRCSPPRSSCCSGSALRM